MTPGELLTDGPDIAEFGSTVDRLHGHDYVVGPSSNHIGLRLGRTDQARAAYERALELTSQAAERRFIEKRLTQLA